VQRAARSRYTWAALGGLALAASFPKLGLAGLAWIAPGWILFSALGRQGWETFRIGYVGGFAYALAAFHWLLFIPFPAGAIAGWVALSAYLALYTATWVWLCWRIFPGGATIHGFSGETAGASAAGKSAASSDELPEVPRFGIESGAPAGPASLALAAEFVRVPLARRVFWAFGCAAIWVALEMVLARLFTGFPWNLLGVSQSRVLPVIQMASVTGVYGVSFLVAWFSVSLANAMLNLISNPTRAKAWVGDLILPLLALFLAVGFGFSELSRMRPPPRTLPAVLIQPSIPQTLIWNTNQNAARFTQLVALSGRALNAATNAQLLVWPEAAVPNMLRYDWDTYQAATNLVVAHHVWMILGSDDAVPRPGPDEGQFDFYNSSFLVTPRGEIAGVYRKRRLVIFGEYIPLERWLPFMKYLTPVGGSFAEGRAAVPFVMPDLRVKTSVLICFEDIFPNMDREYVQDDTDFLLNLTNNGWFGESAAQWQHAANAVFRAVENRIPLVRCANNGLTCWVDPYGGMHDVYFANSTDIYRAGYKVADIPLLGSGHTRTLTFYTRHGDWLGWGCVALTGLLVGWLCFGFVYYRR
jgi:apolipoprotein N-acyltransferase